MWLSVKWLVLWSVWAARLVRQPTAPVRVSGGLLRGAVAPDGSHAQYLAIPYGTVDLENRFQAPGPEQTWEGTFDAVNENVRCKQSIMDTLMMGQENCLILNVYTPLNATPGDKLPVMFFIHGGGYFQGSGSSLLYGPNYLVPKGVILVTINYRLNIQGFLCLGIKEAPGNAAMKDQVAAMKWVQRNIRVFGGDPDNVTIFGESAGSASVSYQVLSPMSKGLFHKAILQSGSSLAAWAYQYKPIYLASLLAKTMEYVSQDPHKLYEYFMNKSDDELILTRVPRAQGNIIVSEILYTPCTETLIDGVAPFLIDTPFNILSKGNFNKVPLIIGFNTEEGLLLAASENDTMLPTIRFEKSLPKDLAFPSDKERNEVGSKLKEFYMSDDEISDLTVDKLSKVHGELNLIHPTLQETELILKTSDKPVYNYVFSYYGSRNLPKITLGKRLSSIPGATHADELFYLFSQALIPSLFENKIIDRMTTLWTNFAKYGDPTPSLSDLLPVKWYPTNSTSPTALKIDEEFTTSPLWYTESLKYLREVYSKYRRKT